MLVARAAAPGVVVLVVLRRADGGLGDDDLVGAAGGGGPGVAYVSGAFFFSRFRVSIGFSFSVKCEVAWALCRDVAATGWGGLGVLWWSWGSVG